MLNKSRALRAASVVLSWTMLDGCGREASPAPPVTEIQVSAAEYAAAPRLVLTPQATLCDAAAGHCDFGDAAAAEADVAGGIMAWDYAKPLRRYDREGHLIGDLGRKGNGPGEYDVAVAAGVSEGGVAVVDIATLRIARFDSAGSFIRFDPLRNLPQSTRALGFLGGDLVIYSVQPLGDGSGSDFRAVRVKAGTSDTLAHQSLPGYASTLNQFQIAGLFAARPIWKGRADGSIVFSPGSSYEIREFHDGHPVRHATIDHAPREVAEAEVSRERERRLASAPAAARDAVTDAIRRVAEVHPSITDLVALPDGGVLAREAENVSADSVRWTRFAPSWNVSGYVVTASTTRVLLVEDGRMLLQLKESGGTALRWYGIP